MITKNQKFNLIAHKKTNIICLIKLKYFYRYDFILRLNIHIQEKLHSDPTLFQHNTSKNNNDNKKPMMQLNSP